MKGMKETGMKAAMGTGRRMTLALTDAIYILITGAGHSTR
jgi:hypothetical protein